MKTLKFIVLLTVMLVNVTPYIKDGKVEWKANEAAAQNYTYETGYEPNGCVLPLIFSSTFNVTPVDLIPGKGYYCVQYVLATIMGGNIQKYYDYAISKYGRADINPVQLVDTYEEFGVKFGVTINNPCSLLNLTLGGSKGVFMNPYEHVYLLYIFNRAGSSVPIQNVDIKKYDTRSYPFVSQITAGELEFSNRDRLIWK